MVAVIKTGHSIHRTLNYNENKVNEGVAAFISAVNYPIDPDKLSVKNKLNRLLQQAALNTNVSRNSVHVSLNFDPSEKHSPEKLEAVATAYMERIGFGGQPYLVYQHFDAAHPHIHIVSIKVREDGSRIDTHNIGRNQSEKARREIEKEFGLVKAASHQPSVDYTLKPITIHKAFYGKSETKRAISNVLDEVLFKYKYTSLPELNAILRQYNVAADRGSETSRIYQSNGLLYRVLDDAGNKTGVPIKASDFYNKPTLKLLNERFGINENERQPHKARLKNLIDLSIIRNPVINLSELIKALEKESVQAIVRQNAAGIIYGITYIDHRTKSVFNGSALGKPYSAIGLQQRLGVPASPDIATKEIKLAGEGKNRFSKQELLPPDGNKNTAIDNSLIDALMTPEERSEPVPWQLKKQRRKRRKGLSK